MSELETLATLIETQGALVKKLKDEKADFKPALATLLDLKSQYQAKNGGVAYGPAPVPKKEKVDVVEPEESSRDGPSKKELNKLKRKAGHTKEGETSESTKPAPSATLPVSRVPVVATPGVLTVFSSSSAPSELTSAVTQLVGATAKFDTTDASNEPMLVGGGFGSISGDASIAKFFVRAAGDSFKNLYDQTEAWSSTQIDQWLQLYDRAIGVNGDAIGLLQLLEAHLADKTFVVGQSFTLADAAMVILAKKKRGAIQPRVAIERWFALASAQMPNSSANSAAKKVSKTPAAATKDSSNIDVEGEVDSGGSCPPLEGAEDGLVCTRFPPEPSGYLHIGHAKACLLNQYYAQRYNGKLIVRFDDTNPSKEKEEYEENILKDLATLKVHGDVVSHTSDWFSECEDYARQLISDGLGYMDDTDQDLMKEERGLKINSKRRDASIEDNLKIFNGLLAGDKQYRAYCLRAKADMQSLNGTMRDPVFYRANETPHHRTGTKFKAYPTYDFACPIVDSLEGVSHALRTTEYNDRDEQYKWVQKALKLKNLTKIMTYGKLNFVHTVLSKRKLNWFVEQKLVEGWFDPRFPTIQGCIRRGIDIDVLKKFIISQGASRRIITMEWDKFWATNKDVLEVTAHRFMGVSKIGHVLVTLENVADEITAHSVPLLPQLPEKGTRVMRRNNKVLVDQADALAFKIGEEVTFLRWGNMKITAIESNPDGSIASVKAVHDPAATNFSKTKKYTWLAAVPDNIECTLVEFDHLISKAKLDDDDNFQNFINPVTRTESTAVCDACLRNVPQGTVIQLERKGFFRVDSAYGGVGKPPILFAIPDGKLIKKK